MKLSNTYTIAVLLSFSISLTAQTRKDISEISFSIHNEDEVQKYCVADLDEDGICDSLTYDYEKMSLVFSLSTRNFEPLSILHEHIGDQTIIVADTGWFNITALHMRAVNDETFIYDSKQQRFRLAQISHENYGNATNDGSGTFSLYFLKGRYEADINFYDYENETLLSCPSVSMQVDNDPIYLDDEEWVYYMPEENFLREYMEKYTPDYCDTITFLGYDIDYDLERLLGEKDGESYSIICNDQGFNRGDVISIKVGTQGYQEVADKSLFYVLTMGYGATKVEEGALSKFYRTNKKEINYHNTPDGYSYSVISPMDVDYYLANTTNKVLLKYFKKPGSFEIEYSKASAEILEELQIDTDYTYVATITHKYKNKQKRVCELILYTVGYITDYYLFDKKSGTYKPWHGSITP